MIVIIDYKMGNIGSIFNMLRKIGADAIISSDIEKIEDASKLILPGIGSFDAGMKNLKEMGLMPILKKKVIKEKTLILGICLGMQLFALKSDEGISNGLGWLDGIVKKFKGDNVKVPHMGWNTIAIKKNSDIFKDIPEEPKFYFAHSYYMDCKNKDDELAVTNYGQDFSSVIRKENIIGVQFHPEKSHNFGMKLLKNFVEIC